MDIQEMINILNSSSYIDDAHLWRNNLCGHPMRPALYDVLKEMKERTGLSQRNLNEDEGADPQLIRLDNMLLAEGICGPERLGSLLGNAALTSGLSAASSSTGSDLQTSPNDNAEYRNKLASIRSSYQSDMAEYQENRESFTKHVRELLLNQAAIRPITGVQVEKTVGIIQTKLGSVEMQLKQTSCEHVMLLRSRTLDARRKRRNFPKPSTQVLTDYFYTHLANPYPSEEAKEELARKCAITVSQVSNWFGNKRIRYKKNMGKAPSTTSDR